MTGGDLDDVVSALRVVQAAKLLALCEQARDIRRTLDDEGAWELLVPDGYWRDKFWDRLQAAQAALLEAVDCLEKGRVALPRENVGAALLRRPAV